MKRATHQQFPPLEPATRPIANKAPATHSAFLHPKTERPIRAKATRQRPISYEKNKLATPHTPARKPNQAPDKSSIDKTHVIAGGLLLLVWVAIIGAQGAIKAAAGVELWSDPVLIAITVNLRLVFVQLIGSGLPLSRSAGGWGRKNKPAARRK